MNNENRIKEIIENKKRDADFKNEDHKFVKEILIIEMNSLYYGLQLEYLREVMDIPDKNTIVPIPYTPSYILGIMNLRGDIIPVVSLLEVLGVPEKKDAVSKIAIMDYKFRIAFPFNEIVDLETIDVKKMKEIKDATRKPEEQFLSHEVEYQDKRVSVIDIYKLFLSQYFK